MLGTWHPLRALDGGLTGGCFGNSSILGGHSSKADSYHAIVSAPGPNVFMSNILKEPMAIIFELHAGTRSFCP